VLLHGYGSNEQELFQRVAPLLPEMPIASVRGPVPEAGGFAWVSLRRNEAGPRPQAPSVMADDVDRALLGWLDNVGASERIGLLGVSQGAVLALHLLRHTPRRFSYVANLSGYVLGGTLPGDAVLRDTRPPVFWGRGQHDDVVPASDVERTSQWLPQHSTLTARTYDVGHTESDHELRDAAAFIRSVRKTTAN
jgi:phospholipase/carboxylesterase